jgi:hypothetical protein
MKYFWSRRDFLFQSGGGVSGLALAYLLNKDGLLAAESNGCNNTPVGGNPYAPKPPHFKPRAKAVISLFMTGGPSHVDTFDPKPALAKYAGEPLTGKGDINAEPIPVQEIWAKRTRVRGDLPESGPACR